MTDAAGWDARYQAAELVWSANPNQWVAERCEALSAGRALDVAAGEGRNSIWLASRGWAVTAVDFSEVALDKGQRQAAARGAEVAARIDWVRADVVSFRADRSSYDLVIVAYLHLVAGQRDGVLHRSAEAVSPGGTLVVIGHDRDNLESGTGGPQNPALLYTPDALRRALDGTDLVVELAEQASRSVQGHRDAIDTVLVARQPNLQPEYEP